LTSLKYLNLSRTKISDDGLRYLERLSRLKHLTTEGSGITEAGMSELRKKLPSIEDSPEFAKRP